VIERDFNWEPSGDYLLHSRVRGFMDSEGIATWQQLLERADASSSLDISINPNPFERPETRSIMMVADSTVPALANASRKPSSLVS